MWKKDGKLVFPSSDAAVDIQEYGRTLVVSQARLEDTELQPGLVVVKPAPGVRY